MKALLMTVLIMTGSEEGISQHTTVIDSPNALASCELARNVFVENTNAQHGKIRSSGYDDIRYPGGSRTRINRIAYCVPID